jgi:hypothetical protein
VVKALSVRQPWAELILSGRKPYELRTWATRHRGPLLIHAATNTERHEAYLAGLSSENLVTGAIVGMVEVVSCGPFTSEMAEVLWTRRSYFGCWREGLYAWELRAPRRLPRPVPWRGRLGLFEVPDTEVGVGSSGPLCPAAHRTHAGPPEMG